MHCFLLVVLLSILTMNCCYRVFPFLTLTPHHFPMARETPHIEWLILMRKWLIGTTEYSLKPWPPFGHLFEYSFSIGARIRYVKNINAYNNKQLLISRGVWGVPVPGTKKTLKVFFLYILEKELFHGGQSLFFNNCIFNN